MGLGNVDCFVRVNDGIKVDYLKVDSKITTITAAVANKDNIDATTLLQNSFDKEIPATYIEPYTPLSSGKCVIYRKTADQSYWNYITTFSGHIGLIDYNVVNKQRYQYLIAIEVPATVEGADPTYVMYKTLDEQGLPYYAETTWDRWSICSILPSDEENVYYKTGSTWILGLNYSGGSLTQNRNVTSYDTLNKYPKVAYGKKNYKSSNFTTLLGSMQEYQVLHQVDNNVLFMESKYGYTEKPDPTNVYSRAIEKLEAWDEFISDGNLKLLKDNRGNAWVVDIVDNPTADINPQTAGVQTQVSFQWQEALDSTKVSVIEINDQSSGVIVE